MLKVERRRRPLTNERGAEQCQWKAKCVSNSTKKVGVILKEEYTRNVVGVKRESDRYVCEGRNRSRDGECCQRLCSTSGL